MTHPWAASDRPLVFAHRGGSRLAPENTLAAFDRAVAEGADGLELDVHLSKDGEVMVCHDPRVDRTTDCTGAIAAMTARELAGVDAGFHFQDDSGRHAFRGRGLGIPMLHEVLSGHPDRRLIIELKDDDKRLADAAVAAVREAGAVERACLGSFHLEVIRHARAVEPRLATSAASWEVRMALYRSWVGLFPRHPSFHAVQVPERREATKIVTPRFVRAAHRAGVVVQVWVVDREEDMRRLFEWGVDGVITDRPDIAVRVAQTGATR